MSQLELTRRRLLMLAMALRDSPSAMAQQPSLIIRHYEHSVPIADHDGRIRFRFPAFSGGIDIDIGEGEQITMMCVPAGAGMMGSKEQGPSGSLLSTPPRQVHVAPFCLGMYEITRAQWLRVSRLPKVTRDLRMPFGPPRNFEEGRIAVDEGISFEQAEEFCARLRLFTGLQFRLPSEAEWEYACRAGTTTRYHFGETFGPNPLNSEIVAFGRWLGVGTKNAPNRYGLHDMHGGVGEWCSDYEHRDYEGAPSDERSWQDTAGNAGFRIFRGAFQWMGSAGRMSFPVSGSFSLLGLRIALSLSHGIVDPKPLTLVNAASMIEGSLSPGQIFTILGENVGPSAPVSIGSESPSQLSLGEAKVYCDTTPAHLIYSGSEQLNAVAPFSLEPGTKVQVIVKNGFQSAYPISVSVEEANPALFTRNGSGSGPVSGLNYDGTVHAKENPARRGSRVIVYGTGFGRLSSPLQDGQIVAHSESAPTLPVRAEIAGSATSVEYAHQTSGAIAGLLEIALTIPSDILPGPQNLVLYVGQKQTQAGVMVFIV